MAKVAAKGKQRTTISATEFQDNIADAVNRAQYGNEWVVITRFDKPAAALVSLADLAKLEQETAA